ncbi:hypothetical protein D4S03_08090 [bacterium]|nr:MAG: hypothetical protein D4S03_08090 [bacterium]
MLNNIINLFVKTAYADDVVGTIALPSGIPSEIGQTGDFITAIIRFLLIIGGLFTLWQFLSGGLAYITSNGEKTKIQEAGTRITTAITGLVIMAASFVIIAIISRLLFGDFTTILIPKFITVTP